MSEATASSGTDEQASRPTKSGTKRSWITDTMLAALIPVECLAIAFAYESGYCSYFKIPVELISVSGGHVLRACGTLLALLFVVYCAGVVLYIQYQPFDTPAKRHLFAAGAPVLVCVGFAFIYGMRLREYWELLAFTLFLSLLPLLIAVVRYRKIKGLQAKLDAQIAFEDKLDSPSERVMRAVGLDTTFVGFLLLVLVLFSYAKGRAEAMDQKEFLVVNGQPPLAVIRIYSDSYICLDLDRGTSRVGSSLHVLPCRETKEVVRNEACGPLLAPERP
jgi:hypothetical protein